MCSGCHNLFRGPTPRVRETPGPPLDMAGRISVVFLVPYRGRLKRPHLHCWADAVAELGLSVRLVCGQQPW